VVFAAGFQTDGRQLTDVMKKSRALGELARILHDQRGGNNYIHVSNAWVFLTRIGRGRGAEDTKNAVAELHERAWDVLRQLGGRAIANVMHSMATAGGFKPQDVANML